MCCYGSGEQYGPWDSSNGDCFIVHLDDIIYEVPCVS